MWKVHIVYYRLCYHFPDVIYVVLYLTGFIIAPRLTFFDFIVWIVKSIGWKAKYI